jgi:FkbM family methyltransferase
MPQSKSMINSKRFISRAIRKVKKWFKTNTTSVKGQESHEFNVYPRIVKFRESSILCSKSNKIENNLLVNSDYYDYGNFTLLCSLVRKGHICFDIGANIGVYSMVLSRLVGGEGEVHCFEPVEHILQKLLINKALNGANNLVINNFALGDKSGNMLMYQVKEGVFRGGTSTLLYNNNVKGLGEKYFDKKNVAVHTLDEYVAGNKIKRVDFIKIDVEGFELNILNGSRKILEAHKPTILFEHDQNRLNDLGLNEMDIYNVFKDYNYNIYEIINSKNNVALIDFNFNRLIRTNNLLAFNISK